MKLPGLLRKEFILKTKLENKLDKDELNFLFRYQLIKENYFELVNIIILKENEIMT